MHNCEWKPKLIIQWENIVEKKNLIVPILFKSFLTTYDNYDFYNITYP